MFVIFKSMGIQKARKMKSLKKFLLGYGIISTGFEKDIPFMSA